MTAIAFVVGIGGPVLEYALPRLRGRGEVHALVLSDPSPHAREQLQRFCTTVAEFRVTARTPHDELVSVIERFAGRCDADVLLTFSEHAVHAVADACERLGLRGAGPNVMRSRDKLLMRECWQRAGVPVPRFVSVERPEDLRDADAVLEKPFVLKPALSSGSLGLQIVQSSQEMAAAWERSCEALHRAAMEADVEYGATGPHRLLAEDIIHSTTQSWYDTPGYGDYLSVEGIVADGTYHPVCITARMPTIPPFTELSNQAPCILPEDRQHAIEASARAAVDALGLQTCGTHTELKLTAGGGLCLIESAARLPGAMVVREVEVAFGLDMIGLLVDALAGDTAALPGEMRTSGARQSAASLALIATDARGRPWDALPVFEPDRVDWRRLVGPETVVEVVSGATLPPGSRMPRYETAAGVLNFAGLLFVVAPDPKSLLDDTYAILNGLEAEFTHPLGTLETSAAGVPS
jgi:biotin carboxylase